MTVIYTRGMVKKWYVTAT